jgi:hypothetical protein
VAGTIFISYSRDDHEYAQQLAGHLTDQGLTVWYDYALHTGDRFTTVIQAQIERCGAFVVVLTPAAVVSQWVNLELSYAHNQGRLILPLLLADVALPFLIHDVQYEDVRGGRLPSAEFVIMLRRTTGSSPVSPTIPASDPTSTPPPAAVLPPPASGVSPSQPAYRQVDTKDVESDGLPSQHSAEGTGTLVDEGVAANQPLDLTVQRPGPHPQQVVDDLADAPETSPTEASSLHVDPPARILAGADNANTQTVRHRPEVAGASTTITPTEASPQRPAAIARPPRLGRRSAKHTNVTHPGHADSGPPNQVLAARLFGAAGFLTSTTGMIFLLIAPFGGWRDVSGLDPQYTSFLSNSPEAPDYSYAVFVVGLGLFSYPAVIAVLTLVFPRVGPRLLRSASLVAAAATVLPLVGALIFYNVGRAAQRWLDVGFWGLLAAAVLTVIIFRRVERTWNKLRNTTDTGPGDHIMQPLAPASAAANRPARPNPARSHVALAISVVLLLVTAATTLAITQPWLVQPIATLTGHTDIVTSVAFSPDGKTLATGSIDSTVRLWDMASHQPIATLTGPSDFLHTVAFSSDDKTVASGGLANTVRLWDVTSQRTIATLIAPDLVTSVALMALSEIPHFC